MPRKRKNGSEEENSSDANPTNGDVYERGGRVLRTRDTCMCPVCGMYFSPTEIQSHAQACLYFLEHESELKKKPKKGLSSSGGNGLTTSVSPSKPTTLSKSDSSLEASPNKTPSPQQPRPPRPEWKPNTVAQWNVPYAPVFRPTVAEFKKPLEYISKIRPIAEKYGVCVVVPPYPSESWNQNIGDPKTFTFRTKVQNIHQLKTRWQGRNEVFVSNLASFLEKRGETLRSFPRVDGRDLDLFKLFSSVVNRGGYQVVERSNLWKGVAEELKLSINCVRNNSLRNHYHKYLFAYEMYRKSKLQYKPASSEATASNDDDLYIAEDITDDMYNTDYLEDGNMEDEFGFYEGDEYTLAKFEKKAKDFSEKWFPTGKPTPEQVEEEFWRIVETAEDSVKVDYGSDLDVTKIHRSGFPRDHSEAGSKEGGVYITDENTHWNLNRLPRMRGSVLSHIKETVAGVTDPMLYVGMLFSSFCWHTEDNYLYSINYMHKGTAKTWYGIPASAAEHFEEVMKAAVPDLFLKHPDLLHLLITMVSPSVLVQNKVPIVRAVQEPGQYVITFPKAYHAGFSHGFTCAEAVNFAPADWLPYGYESVLHYRTIKRPSVFSHEELVCTIANRDPSAETAFWLCGELQKIRDKEQNARDSLRLAGYYVKVLGPADASEEPKQCKLCSYDCYLSSVSCNCSPQYVACLLHHSELCESCSTRSKFLQIIVPLSDLDTLIEKTRKIQLQSKFYIDLTQEDEDAKPVVPNMANMNNISTYSPLSPHTSHVSSHTPQPSPSPNTPQPSPHTPHPSPPTQTTAKTARVLFPAQSPPQTAPAAQTPPQTRASAQSPQPSPPSPPSVNGNQNVNREMLVNSPPPVHSTPPSSFSSSISSPSFSDPSLPPSSPPSIRSPGDTPKKGIVINLAQQPPKGKVVTNPYENKIPPPPILRIPPSALGTVSSFTFFAAKQAHSHSPTSSPLPSPLPTPLPSSLPTSLPTPLPSPLPSPVSSLSPSPSSLTPTHSSLPSHSAYSTPTHSSLTPPPHHSTPPSAGSSSGPNPGPSSGSSSGSGKLYYFHHYTFAPSGEPITEGSPPHGTGTGSGIGTGSSVGATPHGSPTAGGLADHMQGIALNCPPSISGGYTKKSNSGISQKPVLIVLDSPPKS